MVRGELNKENKQRERAGRERERERERRTLHRLQGPGYRIEWRGTTQHSQHPRSCLYRRCPKRLRTLGPSRPVLENEWRKEGRKERRKEGRTMGRTDVLVSLHCVCPFILRSFPSSAPLSLPVSSSLFFSPPIPSTSTIPCRSSG